MVPGISHPAQAKDRAEPRKHCSRKNRLASICLNGYNEHVKQNPKPLRWVGSAKKELLAMPDDMQQVFGFALYYAQIGLLHPAAKPLKGFGSAGVVEIVEDWRGNAYRVVYTVRFTGAVYVLHCFQKKSKRGIETHGQEIDLIYTRLKEAQSRVKKEEE
jgi:phage-related protein